jgi:hypothetical protein
LGLGEAYGYHTWGGDYLDWAITWAVATIWTGLVGFTSHRSQL